MFPGDESSRRRGKNSPSSPRPDYPLAADKRPQLSPRDAQDNKMDDEFARKADLEK